MAIKTYTGGIIEDLETGEIEALELYEFDTAEDLAEFLGIEFLPIADSLIDYSDI